VETVFAGYLLVEVAPPWRYDVGESNRFPQGLWDAVKEAWNTAAIEKFTALMPDPEYSREGHTRVLYFRRPRGALFASYEKGEYVVPEGEVVALVKALAKERDGFGRFARYKEDTSSMRDPLVCTHGSHDLCCGSFGYPLYEELRRTYVARPEARLRVWRTSHLGGHRFAPILVDLPEGRYWGRLEGPENLENLVFRNGPASDLRPYYRGWAGLSGRFEQIAEREILALKGWGWTRYPKAGEVLEADEEGDHAEVRIEYQNTDGVLGAYEATVETKDRVETLLNSGTEPLREAQRYVVSRLEKVTARRK
jgi:hypothetical protein